MTALSLAETDDELVTRCAGVVYNRELLRSCGHTCIDSIARERGRIYRATVRTALEAAGVIVGEPWPEPFAVLDETGLRVLMAGRKKVKSDAP